MIPLLTILPFLISLGTGLLITRMILRDEIRYHYLLHLSLAWGLGLGISSSLGYLNFLILDKFNPAFQITANLLALGLSFLGVLLMNNMPNDNSMISHKQRICKDGLYLVLVLLLFAPIYYMASFYPYGGWDSWAVWQFKSRFLFLSDDSWRNMFDPALWRSSPHYPLLLPLINLWGWVFQREPTNISPIFNSFLFAILSLTLLISSFMLLHKDKIAFLAACLLISSPFYGKTAVSQYADIMLGYYLLASSICIFLSTVKKKKRFALMGGLFIGFLSFTKPEGLVAALILTGVAVLYYLFREGSAFKNGIVPFLTGSAITLALPLSFYFFIAPENMTAINGFISKTDPSTWIRFKTILVYFLIELISFNKWNGLWILLFILILANCKRAFNKESWLIPVFLALYMLTVGTYYLMNTHFEILWWLSVTLDRILGSVLPLVLWWVIYSLKIDRN